MLSIFNVSEQPRALVTTKLTLKNPFLLYVWEGLAKVVDELSPQFLRIVVAAGVLFWKVTKAGAQKPVMRAFATEACNFTTRMVLVFTMLSEQPDAVVTTNFTV